MCNALAGLGIGARMAIHTGETELRDEGNYFGPTIHPMCTVASDRPRWPGVGDARTRPPAVVTASFLTAFEDNGPSPDIDVDG